MMERSIKELLFNLWSYIEKEDNFISMCTSTRIMYEWEDLITYDEWRRIRSYIDDNVIKGKTTSDFWWEVREKEPRLKWLDEQIGKL